MLRRDAALVEADAGPAGWAHTAAPQRQPWIREPEAVTSMTAECSLERCAECAVAYHQDGELCRQRTKDSRGCRHGSLATFQLPVPARGVAAGRRRTQRSAITRQERSRCSPSQADLGEESEGFEVASTAGVRRRRLTGQQERYGQGACRVEHRDMLCHATCSLADSAAGRLADAAAATEGSAAGAAMPALGRKDTRGALRR